jgi:hypothetical protein
MIVVDVDPGICGLRSRVKVFSDDMQHAAIEIESDCPDIRDLAAEIKQVDGYSEVFGKVGQSSIYELARKHCKHAACPVPMAIVKGVEAAIGAALPGDVSVKISKVEE